MIEELAGYRMIAWGIALSSRANFLLLLPIVFGSLAQRHNPINAMKWLMWTVLTCGLLTLPFYFYDRARFAPLEAMNRLTMFDEVMPSAGLLIGVLMLVTSLFLAWRPMDSSAVVSFNCATVQAVPVFLGYLLGHDVNFLAYGSFFLPFGLLAVAMQET